MNRNFQAFAYAWLFFVGAFMFIVTPEGIIRVCIACGSVLNNIIAISSMVIGAIGFVGKLRSGIAG